MKAPVTIRSRRVPFPLKPRLHSLYHVLLELEFRWTTRDAVQPVVHVLPVYTKPPLTFGA